MSSLSSMSSMSSMSLNTFLNLNSTSYLTLLNVSYVLAVLLVLGVQIIPASQNQTLQYAAQNPLVAAVALVAIAYAASYYYTKNYSSN